MALFDVYVEGATDPSPVAVQRLAEVMSQRYGLPAAELVNRITKGRFRVKANVDDATAQTYLRDLAAIGARAVLAEARGASASLPPPTRPKPASQPPPHQVTVPPRMRNESRGSYSLNRNSSSEIQLEPPPVTPRTVSASAIPERPTSTSTPPPVTPRTLSGTSSTPPPVAARTSSGSPLPPRSSSSSLPPPQTMLPPRTNEPPPRALAPSLPPVNYASGLAAAFLDNTPPPELGAFDKDLSLSVGTLDGVDDVTGQLETSPVLPASIGPATRPAIAKADKPKDVPVDLFAPPDAQSEELKFELAVDDLAHRERKRTPPTAVPIAIPPSPSSPVLRPKGLSLPPQSDRSAGVRMPSRSDEEPRWRLAGGVLAAVVLGFIPASCVQSCRESAAFEKIDNHVATVQAQAASSATAPIPFARLDAFREEQAAKKKSERRNIAMVSMLIWALGGAGIGYVWFRRVPWDKIKFGA